ncbi:MAG: 30S ribosomal protein S6 [Syntrophales bacterium]|nr:30S ribosomal protein S6 [Syntrophales bacterium]
MRRYETIFIVQVDLPDDEIVGVIERYRTIITDMKGIVVKIERWGQRKLAYVIKKQAKGYYIFIDFVGVSAVVTELERNFKIDDRILKFITVKKEDKVDLQKIENEIAAAGKKVKEEEVSLPSEIKTTATETGKLEETVTETKTNGGGEESALSGGGTEKEEDKGGSE